MRLPLTNKHLKKTYKIKKDNKIRSFGDTDIDKKVIRINKKMSKKKRRAKKYPEILDTIVHEAKHAKSPHMYEKNVRKHTKKAIKYMGKKVKQKYYKLVK